MTPKPESPGNSDAAKPKPPQPDPPDPKPPQPDPPQLDFIDTISDPEGVGGNAAFVSLLPDPVVHRFELDSQRIEVPAFGGLVATTVEVIAPANVRYVQWLTAIAARVGIQPGATIPRATTELIVNANGVAAFFSPANASKPLLDAVWTPDEGLTLKPHEGGVFDFETTYRWASHVSALISAARRY